MSLEPVDLSVLRGADWQHRSERLTRRIATRLGQDPRALPSPWVLAFHRTARPALLAAAALLAVALTSIRLLDPAPTTSPASVLDLLQPERPPSAAAVYLVMRSQTTAATRPDEQR